MFIVSGTRFTMERGHVNLQQLSTNPLFEYSAQCLKVTSEILLGHHSSWRKNNVNQSLRAARMLTHRQSPHSSPSLILKSATGKDLPPSPAPLNPADNASSLPLSTSLQSPPSPPPPTSSKRRMPRLFGGQYKVYEKVVKNEQKRMPNSTLSFYL